MNNKKMFSKSFFCFKLPHTFLSRGVFLFTTLGLLLFGVFNLSLMLVKPTVVHAQTTPPSIITGSMTANPSTIFLGESSTLSWTTNATSPSIGFAGVAQTDSMVVTPTRTTTFLLNANNGSTGVGVAKFFTATVTVIQPPGVDAVDPTVSITSPVLVPVPGTTRFQAPTVSGTITITANAADDVALAGVQFQIDGSPIGAEDTVAPYSALLNTTSFTNNSHTLRALARDAAGNFNFSDVSIVVNNTTTLPTPALDTTPPTVPGNLTATAISTSQVNLTWTASTDNVGVSGYKIFRNGVQVGTVTGTSFSDTGLSPNTAFTYTVSAQDVNSLESARSNSVSVTTLPVVPATQTLTVTKSGTGTGTVTGVPISCGASCSSAINNGTSVTLTATAASGSTFAGWSGVCTGTGTCTVTMSTNRSVTATFNTVQPPQILQPTVTFTANPSTIVSGQSSTLTWTSTNATNVSIDLASSALNGSMVVSPTQTTSYSIVADSGAGSPRAFTSVTVTVVSPTPTLDTTPPTTPTNLTAIAVSSSQVNLTWNASTDNVGVISYQIFRNGVSLGSSNSNSFADSRLSSGTVYRYNVLAIDAAGNKSSQSSSATVTTSLEQDNSLPTVTITNPSNNRTVSGLISISATAVDPTVAGTITSGVASVVFKVDGTTLFVAINSPYSTTLDTLTLSNGAHVISAVASDVAGNLSQVATINITVNNQTTVSPTPTLGVEISASPSSGTAPLSGVSLKANLSGTAVGNSNYYFYCNQRGWQTDASSAPDFTLTDQVSTEVTAKNICSYQLPGVYVAKVIVERNGQTSYSNANVRVDKPVVIEQPNPTPTPTPNPTPSGQLNRTLRLRSTGNDVVILQNFLIAKGFLPSGNNTGYFGVLTRTAVQQYQCSVGIVCDGNEDSTGYGMVGRKTRAAINAELSAQ